MNIQEIRAQIVQQLIPHYASTNTPAAIIAAVEEICKYIEHGLPKKEEAPKVDEPKQSSQWSQIIKDYQDKQAAPSNERWYPNVPPYFPDRAWMQQAITLANRWPLDQNLIQN